MKSNKTLIALALSAGFHFAFFYSCVGPAGSGDEGDGKNGKFAGDVKVHILPKTKGDIAAECTEEFGGIGVEYDYMNVITKLPEGNPAELAGLKIGDQFINPSPYNIRGEIGTMVVVEVMRNDTEYLKFDIKRGKICNGI